MLVAAEIEIVRGIIDACKQQTLDLNRDEEKINHAVLIVRENIDNPLLCSKVHPTELEEGDAIAFLYNRADVNEPFRFGIVNKFNAGCWITFTFNIKRKRDKKSNKIMKDKPGFRQYELAKMSRVRRVCRSAVQNDSLPVAEDLARLGQGVRDLMRQIFQAEEKKG